MTNLYWTKKELFLLEEWDWVVSYIESIGYENASDNDFQRKFLLESQLLINNKYLVVHKSDSNKEILSFYYYASFRREKALKKYHPINFKDFETYKTFLTNTREAIIP